MRVNCNRLQWRQIIPYLQGERNNKQKEEEILMKDKFINGLLMVASKLQMNRYMSSIKHAFTANMPIIIAGAFGTLVANVVTSTTTTGLSLAKLPGMAFLGELTPIFNSINYATINFFAIGIVVLIAIELGKYYGHEETMLPVVVLASYIAVVQPFTTFKYVDAAGADVVATIANVLPRNFTDARGLFLAMIIGIIATELYVKLVDSHKLDIKMPEQVPTNIAKSFSVLFPSILTILIVAVFGFVFFKLTGLYLYDAIFKFIQEPMKGLLTGLPGYLVLVWMTTLLWSVGIHGTQVLQPIYQATLLQALTENMDAVNAGASGSQIPNILNTSFMQVFSTGSGAGMTAGLIVAILLFSKRDDYKTIAKLSIPIGLFNINETMTFGLPIVLNPLLIIPFMAAPAASATFGYFMTKIGVAIPMAYTVPWTTPPLLKSWLSTGGHMGTVLVELGAYVIAFLIYIPFVLIANKQQVSE